MNNSIETPIYQQIVQQIARDIRSGVLPVGYKLPTVRELSRESNISQGTAKHAYDTLENLGLIEKAQGRGTFVCDLQAGKPAGKKEQALNAIDRLLDEMLTLSFSVRDIRIFLDLKLRDLEQKVNNVRVGAVDCCVETLSIMTRQMLALPHVDIFQYSLDSILESPQCFDPALDIIVTTHTHFAQLKEKMLPESNLIRSVMATQTDTALAIYKIPADVKVGAICASARFASIILQACEQYSALTAPPEMLFFGDVKATKAFASKMDVLILPPFYSIFCTRQEQTILESLEKQGKIILYQYEIEHGSLLYLEEQTEKIYRANQQK